MKILHLVLLIIAAVCFFIAFIAPGIGTRTDNTAAGLNRWNLVALGLFAWVLVPLTELIEDWD